MKLFNAVLCLGALGAGNAYAGAADYVHTPNVEFGEREIDFKFGSADGPGDARESAASIGFGYGAREHWFTELYLKREQGDGEHARLAEWENKFQLTETGKYPVDVGLIIELELPVDGGKTDELAVGPLFQTDFGLIQLNGNLIFERQFNDGAHHDTALLYQWQAKYRWRPGFEFGLQGFGEVGKWDDWDTHADQQHRLGPAVFGKVGVGKHQFIRYNAAWLVGTTPASYDHSFRVQVEYEF